MLALPHPLVNCRFYSNITRDTKVPRRAVTVRPGDSGGGTDALELSNHSPLAALQGETLPAMTDRKKAKREQILDAAMLDTVVR